MKCNFRTYHFFCCNQTIMIKVVFPNITTPRKICCTYKIYVNEYFYMRRGNQFLLDLREIHKWENDTGMHLLEVNCESADWTEMAHNRK